MIRLEYLRKIKMCQIKKLRCLSNSRASDSESKVAGSNPALAMGEFVFSF